MWAARGEDAHRATVEAFAAIEQGLADRLGPARFDELKAALFELSGA